MLHAFCIYKLRNFVTRPTFVSEINFYFQLAQTRVGTGTGTDQAVPSFFELAQSDMKNSA